MKKILLSVIIFLVPFLSNAQINKKIFSSLYELRDSLVRTKNTIEQYAYQIKKTWKVDSLKNKAFEKYTAVSATANGIVATFYDVIITPKLLSAGIKEKVKVQLAELYERSKDFIDYYQSIIYKPAKSVEINKNIGPFLPMVVTIYEAGTKLYDMIKSFGKKKIDERKIYADQFRKECTPVSWSEI